MSSMPRILTALTLVTALPLLTGCETLKTPIGAGAATGAAVGGVVGSTEGKALEGAAIGGVVGGATGAIIDEANDND